MTLPPNPGDYTASVDYYTCAIALQPEDAVFYNNRALAYMRLRRWKYALADCNTVLALERGNIKAYARRWRARMQLGDLKVKRGRVAGHRPTQTYRVCKRL
jgi:serine/threonine-protein phosphatase 5